MTELSIRQEMNLNGRVDEIAEKIERRVNQAALDKAASTLEEYGYVKVVRCRDCKYVSRDGKIYRECYRLHGYNSFTVEEYGFCAWAKRKEGGE